MRYAPWNWSEPARAWTYRVLNAVVLTLGSYSIITESQAAGLSTLLTALLSGVMAIANTSTARPHVEVVPTVPDDVVRTGLNYVQMRDSRGNIGNVRVDRAITYARRQERVLPDGRVEVDEPWTFVRKGDAR